MDGHSHMTSQSRPRFITFECANVSLACKARGVDSLSLQLTIQTMYVSRFHIWDAYINHRLYDGWKMFLFRLERHAY